MGRLIEILLVDDNATDIRIMQEALDVAHVANRLHSARDGVEAMAFLRRENSNGKAPRPDLILLDVNMPRKGGLEVLAEIKADPELRSIPTVMLTSSADDENVARAYKLQANGFVVKPVDLDDFITVVGGIEQYWSGIATLPKPVVA